MLLDPKTVVALLVVACALQGVIMISISRLSLRDFSELRIWAWAALMQGLGWFVLGPLRQFIPDVLSVLGGQLLLGVSLALWSAVVHRFVGVRFRTDWAIVLLALEVLALFFYTIPSPNPPMRQVVLSVCHCAFMFAAARALARTSPRLQSQGVMATMFAGSGMVFATRGAVFALAPHIANPTPFEVHPFTTISYILFFIIAIALPFGLLLMCNERHLQARDRAERELLRAATVDALTQVHNRAAVTAYLGDALSARTPRHPHLCAVLFLDMDNFKSINDSLGHVAGDQLLVEAARRLKEVVRQTDLVAQTSTSVGRFGGDEFVVVLADVAGSHTAGAVAGRILDALSVPFTLRDRQMDVRCSIGVSVGRSDVSTTQSLLHDADLALYAAKAKGKGNYVLFEGTRSDDAPADAPADAVAADRGRERSQRRAQSGAVPADPIPSGFALASSTSTLSGCAADRV